MALTSGLQGYWKLDEASGNAADSSGNGNTLVNTGSITYVSAKINNGADMERGSSQYFTIADGSQTGLDASDEITLAGWVNFESTSAGQLRPLASKRDGSNGYLFYLVATNSLQFQIVGAADAVVTWTPSTATWYHVGVTKSGTTVKFYVNGSQEGTNKTLSTSVIPNTTAAFQLGTYNSTTSETMDGIMDEWGMWNRALSAAEISELYNAGSGLSYPFTTVSTFRNFFVMSKPAL